MAKHFKETATPEDTLESTAAMSPERTRGAQRRVNVEGTSSLPYGQVASYRASYSDAAPTDEYFLDDLPRRGGIYAFGRGVCLLIAWLLRICALAFMLLLLANALNLPVFTKQLAFVTDTVTAYLPWRRLGLLAVDTPFGGTFRGDLALISLFFFVLDWLFCRLRARLR